MLRLDPEKLRFVRLHVQSNILAFPSGTPGVSTGNPSLTPGDASAIYSSIARYGFTSFQLIPGGVQVASPDGATVLSLTGAAWSFVEDLSRTAGFEPALEKMGVALTEFTAKFSSPPLHVNQVADLHARWDGAPGGADAYIDSHFLSADGRALASGLGGVTYNGAGVRFNFLREPQSDVPALVSAPAGARPAEVFDLRIEPLFVDKAHLFLQATGMFPPTFKVDEMLTRARFVRELLSEKLVTALSQD